MTNVRVTEIRFASASSVLRSKGLCGWVCCEYGNLQLDGLRVHRAEDGEYSLGFPRHVNIAGIERGCRWPLDQTERDSIEEQVLRDLRRREKLP